jgi:hypothetical protein
MRKRTGRNSAMGSLLAAGILCLAATAARAATLEVTSAQGNQGTAVAFSVILHSEGANVAGTQSDIAFDPTNAPVVAKQNGKPDCGVNPDINKGATSFAFRPNGCSGSSCTAVRALVLATDNVDPIPDGSTLFTCNVGIPEGAADGVYPLEQTGVILSNPDGGKVTPANSTDGAITVGTGGGGGHTCAAPRSAPAGPGLWIPDQQGQAGTVGVITIKLAAGGAQIAGTQSDIAFPTSAPIAAKSNGKPDCTVNADINKGATSFAFRPNGCSGSDCTAVRALVLATDNVDAIPDGSALFICNVNIAASASNDLDYTFSGVILSDPDGGKVTDAGDQDGIICIPGGGAETPTPEPTATASPTPQENAGPLTLRGITASDTTIPVTDISEFPSSGTIEFSDNGEQATYNGTTAATAGSAFRGAAVQAGTLNNAVRGVNGTTAIAHPAGTGIALVQPSSVVVEDEGGCQIGTASHGSNGWLLLVPMVGLLALRRRAR